MAFINTSPPDVTISINGSDITDKVLDYEIGRTNITQGLLNLVPEHGLSIKPGQEFTSTLPFAKRLLVQTVVGTRVTLGCWLAVFREGTASEPDKVAGTEAGLAIEAILEALGVPKARLKVSLSTTLGNPVTMSDSPESIAEACGYKLYSDENGDIRVTPLTKTLTNIGSFDKSEIINSSLGTRNPLSAQRLVCSGVLSKVAEGDAEWESETETTVRGGKRTIKKEFKIKKRKTIETEVVTEPSSQVSSFASNYEQGGDSGKLLSRFYATQAGRTIVSLETEIVTEYDKDGYLESRKTTVQGVKAKTLSNFFAAWASAEAPKPPDNPDEGIYDENGVEYEYVKIYESGSSSNGYTVYGYVPVEVSPFGGGDGDQAMTLRKPSGMFQKMILETIEETWEYDIPKERNTVTSLDSEKVSFGTKPGTCKYERVRMLPIGAILPEMGNPYFGYQTVSYLSKPIYRSPDRLTVAEKEVIHYTQDEAGEWSAERILEQAVGIRNSQEPIDAMKSVQFEGVQAKTVNRAHVALNVATQVTLAAQSRTQTSPPGKTELSEDKPYTMTRDYKFELEIDSDSVLDRAVGVTAPPYCPNTGAIVDLLEYRAMEVVGQSKAINLELPLRDLNFDIPPRSRLTYEGDIYFVNSLTAKSDFKKATLTLQCYPKL